MIFPDSKIGSKMTRGITEISAILNEALSPFCHDYIVSHCKLHPYSAGTGGSNDTGVEKMKSVCIRIFDINTSFFRYVLNWW